MAPPPFKRLPAELSLVVHNRTRQAIEATVSCEGRQQPFVAVQSAASSDVRTQPTGSGHLSLVLKSHVTLELTLERKLWRKRKGRACRTRRLTAAVGSPLAAFALYDNDKEVLDVVLLEEPDRANWMSLLPSSHSLADFCLPGTHETLAEFGWPHSSCQSTQSVKVQLERGIRLVDLRFALNKKGVLRAYHGIQPEYILASDVFDELYTFLDEHPTETVIVSIKQENAVKDFQAKLLAQIDKRLDLWWLENSMPTLGEARGKCIMFSRFGTGAKLGIHPSSWPNNSSKFFDWPLNNLTVRTQDWYDLGSLLNIPEKASKVTALLDGPRPDSVWRLDFASAASVPFGSFPCAVSRGVGFDFAGLGIRGVNTRLCDWLVRRLASGVPLEGCTVLLDYFEFPQDSLVTLLIGANFDRNLEKVGKA